ncbi:phage holin family protein [Anaeromicropila populeti]|uniref:Holin, TcdE family n=1 Tax=Anaeromicropila populeti TaxID=37658 RepID=A0A1I6JIG0_9FIRM|nr:phage holin family protein [Anaeromicropila populeti]SFR78722.1 holin, TcdE family [Anaeromicropila populeti]
MEKVYIAIKNSAFIKLVIIAVVMDTVFGLVRAFRQKKLNSSVGIDGGIRKISMLVSIVFTAAVDVIVHVNFIGFIPVEIRNYFPPNIQELGLAEFFAILYLTYEIVSILKNMTLCGLPVKKMWDMVQNFLRKYTNELPDTLEEDRKKGEL